MVRYTQSAGFPPFPANYTPFSKPLYASRNQDMINSLTTPGRIHIITISNSNRENPLVQGIVEILWETKNNNEKMQIWEISFGKTTHSHLRKHEHWEIRLQRTLLHSTQHQTTGTVKTTSKRWRAKSSYCETRCGKTQIRQRTFFTSSKLLRTRKIRTWTDDHPLRYIRSWEPLLRVFVKTFHSNKIIDRYNFPLFYLYLYLYIQVVPILVRMIREEDDRT